jgi:NMD protein affecting ribosome stability and mRNA decay
MASWKNIPEIGVSCTFACSECGAEAHGIGPEAIASNGAPMCHDCDVEMQLSNIEVDMDLLK